MFVVLMFHNPIITPINREAFWGGRVFRVRAEDGVGFSTPREVQELGRVLTRIIAGDTKVDLSGLPEERRETIERTMDEGGKMKDEESNEL